METDSTIDAKTLLESAKNALDRGNSERATVVALLAIASILITIEDRLVTLVEQP